MKTKHFAFLMVLFALPAIAAPSNLLLRGGIVHTISGETLSPGDVLLESGRIKAVGAKLPAANSEVLDLKGQHLYPGLIAANTSLGLLEISSVRATRDTSESGQFTPDVHSWIAVNPDSELIPVARANGITHAQPVPSGGIVSGHSGLIALAGWTTEQMTHKKPVALHLSWPSMDLDTRPKEEVKTRWKSLEDQAKDRRAKLKAIDDFFAEAKAYRKAREAKPNGVPLPVIPAWESMLAYAAGEIPLMIRADDVRQIKTAVGWAETNGVKFVLVGGRDAGQIADWLGAKKVSIVYESVFSLPAQDSASYDRQYKTPSLLHTAGAKVILSEGGRFDATSVRNLPYVAAQAAAHGLPHDEALRAITLYPAQALGVGDRLGSIEPGKDASLFIADGDILDIRSNVKRMWIAGQEVSLESRHTRLYDKYRNRPTAR